MATTLDINIKKISPSWDVGAATYTYTVNYTCDLSDKETAAWVLQNMDVPYTLTLYGDPRARLLGATVKALDDEPCLHFLITGNYSNAPGEWLDPGTPSVKIQYSSAEYEVVVERARDRNGNWIDVKNSAGDKFDPPLVDTEKRLVMHITQSYSSSWWSPTYSLTLGNSVNASGMIIGGSRVPPRGAWMKTVSPSIVYTSSSTYIWSVVFEIELMPNGKTYDANLLDQGFFEVDAGVDEGGEDGAIPRRRRITVFNSSAGRFDPVNKPVKLNGAGSILASGAKAVFLTYRAKKERNWASLNLPTTPTG